MHLSYQMVMHGPLGYLMRKLGTDEEFAAHGV
jgi:hypothetical protein